MGGQASDVAGAGSSAIHLRGLILAHPRWASSSSSGGACSCRQSPSFTSFAAGQTRSGSSSSSSSAASARSSTSPSRWCPTSGCSARCSTPTAAAAHQDAGSAGTENPASGNYEDLGDLYLDEQKWARAKECYDKAIGPRSTDLDPLYRRGIAEIDLGDFHGRGNRSRSRDRARAEVRLDRAIALLAHAYANSGQTGKAQELFTHATEVSTLSETCLNYAAFLASQNRKAEAREWAERILARKATMPRYLQRRERPWFRKAKALLKGL